MENSRNEIFDRILKDAQEKAERIITDAKKSGERLIMGQRQKARQNAEKRASSILNKAENDSAIIRGKVFTDTSRRASWIVLSEKNRLINNVLDEAKNRLLNLQNSENYVQILEKLIVNAGKVLGGGKLEVVLNEKDLKLPINFYKLEKEISEKSCVQSQLKVSDQQTKSIGVIVKTFDDQIFVDNTFETILKRREKEFRLGISRILFNNID